ncbi:GNAT family N-acetyltransferase [Rugamonas sp.]|uniref:GNAT family N-acetyltransferase n=1 Tax=Rugamonas sp. TaxID=1926287 RepID=UPI0025D277AF|nr:GNAT family N-acetyltransferase [Rugamonas sp.]
MTILTTQRLRLEPMDYPHLDGLHAMNSDPEVMRFILGRPETIEETAASIERVRTRWAAWGFSWWTFFERESGDIVGAGCIQYLGKDEANPLEIGWRLRRDKWKLGYASEAANAMAAYAFEVLDAELLCSICHPDNAGSARVMTRLGMTFKAIEQWDGSDVALHSMTRVDWLSRRAAAGG